MPSLRILVLAATLVAGQGGDADAQAPEGPRAAVDQLFLGMRMANETILRSVLAPNVRFAVVTPEGVIAEEALDGFIRSVAASAGAWNEQIYDVEVHVDEAMASVWAPYTFYLSGRFSHCGINSIELLRGADGWKITQISDTRRTEGCPDPLGGP